jgi:hypothetical protein
LVAASIAAAFAKEVVQVWPENHAAWLFFLSICTQWRMGPNGPSGLDYVVLHRELDDLGLTGEERQSMKDDIREIEYAALGAMYSE